MNIKLDELFVGDEDPRTMDRLHGLFLDLALDRINATTHPRLPSDTTIALEGILRRTLERAHDDIAGHEEIEPEVLRNLAKLMFLDTLDIATGDKVKASSPEEVRAQGTIFRRLFADQTHVRRPLFGRR
jgi:hypothetical protein